MFGTVLLQFSALLIQWTFDGPARPELQSERTWKAEQRGSLLQLPLPCCTHSAAVVHGPVDRWAPEQSQWASAQPEAEMHEPLVRTNPAGAAGQVPTSAAVAVAAAAGSNISSAALCTMAGGVAGTDGPAMATYTACIAPRSYTIGIKTPF